MLLKYNLSTINNINVISTITTHDNLFTATNEYAVVISASADFSLCVHFVKKQLVKASKVYNQHGVNLKAIRYLIL